MVKNTIVRLSTFYKVKEEESIPIADLGGIKQLLDLLKNI